MTGRRDVIRLGIVLAMVIVGLMTAGPAAAQSWCQDWVRNFLDSSSSCVTSSSIPRYFGSDVMSWEGSPYLVVNYGNDLMIRGIGGSHASTPYLVDASYFNVPNQGDSDYDLMSFSVCDDCRYGAANFKLGLVVFELEDSTPHFGVHRRWEEATSTYGSFVFAYGGEVYLLANGLGDSCANGTAGVYRISRSGGTIELERVGCVAGPGGAATQVFGGVSIRKNGVHHLWLSDANNMVHIYRVDAAGDAVALTLVGPSQTIRAEMRRGRGIAIDADAELAATAGAPLDGIRLWSLADPADPQLLWADDNVVVHRIALAPPLLWAGKQGSVYDTHTWDISYPTAPVELDTANGGFWNPANPWNDFLCERDQDGVFHPDGHILYLNRYTVAQVYDVGDCGGPTPPWATMSIDPPPDQSAMFPGDVVTVRNTSWGGIQRSAIWVTPTADPGGTVVAGSPVLSAGTPPQLALAIPVDLQRATSYWAHVAVESNGFPYDPGGSTPDQLVSREITIDRTPTVVISYSETPTLGVEVDLIAAAEGHPGLPLELDAFTWTLSPPDGGSPIVLEGALVPFTFDVEGAWDVWLTVQYRHQDPAGSGDQRFVATAGDQLYLLTFDFSFVPSTPEIGETVAFQIDGIAEVDSATWGFGGSGCDPFSSPTTCTPGVGSDCLHQAYAYSSAGAKTVTLTAVHDGIVFGPISHQLAVLPVGSCAAGCQYAIEPDGAEADPEGDSGSIVLTTGVTCPWTAVSHAASWLSVVSPPSGSGTGAATIEWAAAANQTGEARVGEIEVGGQLFLLHQDPVCTAQPPQPVIVVSPSPAVQGQSVTFSATPGRGGSGAKGTDDPRSVDFQWTPLEPEVGEMVELVITGVDDVDQTTWDFGAVGCGLPSQVTCTPLFIDCLRTAFRYAVPGTHVVSLSVTVGGVTIGPLVHQLTVLDQGSCSGDVGEDWSWTITLDGQPVTSSREPWFTHAFTRPGIYTVELVATNCAGSGSDQATFVVQPSPELAYDAVAMFPAHTTPRSAIAFGGSLLVATEGMGSGGGLFRRSPEGSWGAITADGFGDPTNIALSALTSYSGWAYAGTYNPSSGAQLWRSPDGVSWVPMVTGGFTGPTDFEVSALATHGGDLLAEVASTAGVAVWRTANGVDWEQVNLPGFGDPGNTMSGALASFDNQLYATIANPWSCEVWRRVGGTTWQQVGADGFGDNANTVTPAMTPFDGALYVGTHNEASGCELWRSTDGTSWSQVASDGFGGPAFNRSVESLMSEGTLLFAGTFNFPTGGELWASADGTSWYPWVLGGFGDQYNWSDAAVAVLGGNMFVATENPFGFQVWRLDLPAAVLFRDGFETGDTSAWSGAVGR